VALVSLLFAIGEPTDIQAGSTSALTLVQSTSSPSGSGIQSAPLMRHRDPAGKPCLTVIGSSRAHATNSNLYDHLITATNACAKGMILLDAAKFNASSSRLLSPLSILSASPRCQPGAFTSFEP